MQCTIGAFIFPGFKRLVVIKGKEPTFIWAWTEEFILLHYSAAIVW